MVFISVRDLKNNSFRQFFFYHAIYIQRIDYKYIYTYTRVYEHYILNGKKCLNEKNVSSW